MEDLPSLTWCPPFLKDLRVLLATWTSVPPGPGDKTKVSRYDHLLPAQTKENHKGYDHLNPTVVVTDEESVPVTPDNSSTDM